MTTKNGLDIFAISSLLWTSEEIASSEDYLPYLHSPRMEQPIWSYPFSNVVVYPRAYPPGFHPLGFLARQRDIVE